VYRFDVALILPAYAKLNLTLDVTGLRPDGYHEIDSVMQTISLHDLISVERTECRVFDAVGPPISGENLVLKAARELEGYTSRALEFTIRLFKRIPMAAGLGGGSADAAAFLKAANRLYDLKLKHAELIEIATAVGQDVPFFLKGGTARATGLGSTLSPLRPVAASWRFLVIFPPVEVSTRAVYDAVDGSQESAHRTPALVTALTNPPPQPSPARGEVPASIPSPSGGGQGGGGGGRVFGNDLEPASRRVYPALDEAIDRLRRLLPDLTMTGTGAALFALVPGRVDGESALASVRGLGYSASLCRPVPATA
jgi:4-diphosphocytidyl-2-C-methyl-D-erythritol kinase